ncbi:ComF family protein [Rhizobium laguerreae]|uniref:ComF family protein n=1 Tax=Rhizobium laguerreae TaxID=1076926 RepID=UPI001C92002C|nr:ComF family protein [Rhizobium laguerreae]MBY3474083.1 ComF family protein [Rhizobium laguerreae]MBY3521876.1 ComF family protein [Rhizobium laguerreae]
MNIKLKKISGSWDDGYALDKHMLSSTFIGYSESGRPLFDNKRTESGEAVYRLKYKSDWSQSAILASAINQYIVPHFPAIGLIIPMPPSQVRGKQPVDAVAEELAELMGVNWFDKIIIKSPSITNKKLKDLGTREEKDAELAGRFSINDAITSEGKWNALLVDDLFDSGASMEAATNALRTYKKIDGIYVAALTWK